MFDFDIAKILKLLISSMVSATIGLAVAAFILKIVFKWFVPEMVLTFINKINSSVSNEDFHLFTKSIDLRLTTVNERLLAVEKNVSTILIQTNHSN